MTYRRVRRVPNSSNVLLGVDPAATFCRHGHSDGFSVSPQTTYATYPKCLRRLDSAKFLPGRQGLRSCVRQRDTVTLYRELDELFDLLIAHANAPLQCGRHDAGDFLDHHSVELPRQGDRQSPKDEISELDNLLG